jgi:hypothetical protein
MRVSAATDGHGRYRLYVGFPNRDRFFSKHWKKITVEIEGEPHPIELSDCFWKKCPELRSSVIRDWLGRKGLLTWPSRKPPKFELELHDGSHFVLRMN